MPTSSRALSIWLPVVAWAAVIFAFSSIPSLGTGLGVWDTILRKGAHLTEYGEQATAVRDPRHTLVEFSGATITPEAAVYVSGDGAARLAYRGRIDDRYVDFGRARPQPLKRDLREALEALLAGRSVVPQTTPAVGCIIADLK